MIARAKVLASRPETPATRVVRIERPRGFDFAPVQFVGLELATDEGRVEYPMSLASSPTRPYLEFGARVASGSAWKRAFGALAPGDEVEIDGPYGRFVLREDRPAVLVAGGIGVTPLRGMLQYVHDKRLPIPVTLLYSNRSSDEIAFREELDALAAATRGVVVVHTVTRPDASWTGRRGRIGEAMLREAAERMDRPVFYVCGLPRMVVEVVRTLLATGVPRADVRFEEFFGYE